MACSHSAASTSPSHPSASISRTFRRFPIFQTAPIPSGVPPKLLQRRPLFLSLLCHSPTPYSFSATSRVSTASIVTATFRIPRSFRQKDESMTRQYVKRLLHQESARARVCVIRIYYDFRIIRVGQWIVVQTIVYREERWLGLMQKSDLFLPRYYSGHEVLSKKERRSNSCV